MNEQDRQTSLPGFERESRSPTQAGLAEGITPTGHAAPIGPPPESLQGQTVWVIDAHSLIYQVFHALPEMTSPRGEPVAAVYGFTRDVLYLLQEKKPDFLFCAFDLPGKTFRHEIYDQYKIQRTEMPEELVPQIASIRQVIEALGVPAVGCPSYEADDVMATIARVAEELGGRCFLVTGDKDCRQLITDRVKLYNIRKNRVFDREALKAEWGISPQQVVDFQALVGDPIDNVPGVPLIGPKFAQQLLEKYGTLENVLDHADEVSGVKRRENLLKQGEQALLSRRLVRLERHVPVAVDWTAGRFDGSDRSRAQELFHQLGFHSLAAKLDLLGGKPPPQRPATQLQYRIVDTPQALDAFAAKLRQQRCICCDTETVNISTRWAREVWPRWAQIVGFSFAFSDGEAWYLPVRAPAGQPCLDFNSALEALRPVLEDPAVEKVGQNLKYDMIVLRSAGVKLAGLAFDSMVAGYLLEPGQRNHNLNELAKRYLHHATIKIEELIGTGKNQKRMDEVPVRQVAQYAGEDALLPLRLRPILTERLAQADLDHLFTQLELPLVDVLVERPSGRTESPLRCPHRCASAGDLRAGRASAEHRLAQATSGGVVCRVGVAGGEEDQDRAEHRR
jgi:DNA polymerase-1